MKPFAMKPSGNGAAVAPMPPGQVRYLPERNPFEELKERATLAYKSGLLPASIKSAEQAIIIAAAGAELGLPPMAALGGIYVVNGRFALWGATMLRLVYERVPGARITVLTDPEQCDRQCEVEMARPNGKPQIFRFTIEEARRAGFLSKPIWQQHTSTMLRWAAIRTGARIVFADAIAGCYMEDEIENDSTNTQRAEIVQAIIEAKVEPPALDEPAELPQARDYIIPVGVPKWAGKRLGDVDAKALADYCIEKHRIAKEEKKVIRGPLKEFLEHADAYLCEVAK